MTKPCYPALYEEWLLRVSAVEDRLVHRRGNDEEENKRKDNGKSQTLSSAVMAAHAGQTGSLICTLMEESHKENSEAIEGLLHQMELEVNAELMEACSRPGMLFSGLPDRAGQNNETVNEKDVDMAVDSFFDDYPECRREPIDSASEDDSHDENDFKQGKQPGSKRAASSVDVGHESRSTNHTAPTLNAGVPVRQKNPYARQPEHPHDRETGFTRPPRKGTLPQTRTTAPRGWEDVESFPGGAPLDKRLPESTATAPNTWGDTRQALGPTFTNRSHPNVIPRASINDAPSWEPIQNKQNPFQTALEYGEQEGGWNSNDAEEKRLESEGRSTSCLNSYGTRQGNVPYNSYEQTEQQQIEAQTRIRSPNIPKSLKRKFQPPKRSATESQHHSKTKKNRDGLGNGGTCARPSTSRSNSDNDEELPEALHGLDKELVDKIQNEIIETGESVTFDDIAGLADAKQTVLELVCWPMKRPDLFTGLRRGTNGLLMFGPPGTGKTLIGKAIAHESGACFFSISSSSLTSKWIGEGEKLVRTLFAVAAYKSPAVVFIDEIDSLLTQRKADENEASRRIKTEFLVQLDGTGSSHDGLVLVIGATNRPHELDDAARRRFVKRLYIPLPAQPDREVLLHTLLSKNRHLLTEKDLFLLSTETEGFSGADLKALCTDAAMFPIRELGVRALEIEPCDIPPISYKHFRKALRGTKPSVAQADLDVYIEWNKTYGSRNAGPTDEEDGSDVEESDCNKDGA